MANLPENTPFGIRIATKVWGTIMLPLILRRNGVFSRRAADFFEIKLSASNKPVNGICSRDLVLDAPGELWVRIFSPSPPPTTPSAKCPVVFYFHGGFFAFSSPATAPFDKICRRIAEDCTAVVISVNYRRIPEHRYPAQVEDGYKTIKWFQANTAQFELADFSQSFLVGDSAGGNLVYNVACKLAEVGEESLRPVGVKGQVLIQPAFGGEAPTDSEVRFQDVPFTNRRFSDWRWKVYLPDGADRDHVGSNPFGTGCREVSDSWIPPTLVIMGGYCPTQDRQKELVEKLKAAGKEVEAVFYPDGFHAFYLFPNHSSTSSCHEEVAKFIKSRTSPQA